MFKTNKFTSSCENTQRMMFTYERSLTSSAMSNFSPVSATESIEFIILCTVLLKTDM